MLQLPAPGSVLCSSACQNPLSGPCIACLQSTMPPRRPAGQPLSDITSPIKNGVHITAVNGDTGKFFGRLRMRRGGDRRHRGTAPRRSPRPIVQNLVGDRRRPGHACLRCPAASGLPPDAIGPEADDNLAPMQATYALSMNWQSPALPRQLAQDCSPPLSTRRTPAPPLTSCRLRRRQAVSSASGVVALRRCPESDHHCPSGVQRGVDTKHLRGGLYLPADADREVGHADARP
jgi:hypothetical protein